MSALIGLLLSFLLSACDGGGATPSAPVGELALADIAVVYSGETGDEVGYSVAAADLDGDGRSDLLASGLPKRAWIALAPHRGGALADQGVLLDAGDNVSAVAGLGDTDGDGDGEGAVAVRFDASEDERRAPGGPVLAVVDGGPDPGAELLWVRDSDLEALNAGGTVDYEIYGPRDVDGDGLADLWVGQDGWGEDNEGQARLLSGPIADEEDLVDAGLIVEGGDPYHRLGSSLGGGGDWDGDGINDLAVGSGTEAEALPAAIYLLQGGETGVLQASDTAFARIVATAWPARGAGDVDGDGYDDLLVLVEDAVLLYGPLSGDIEADAARDTVTGPEEGFYSGAIVGDIDQDGFHDLALGDRGGFLAEETGAVYVFYGPVLGHASLGGAGATLTGLGADSYTGQDLAPAGDADGDGYADLLVGAPGAYPDSRDDDLARGAVALVLGGAR